MKKTKSTPNVPVEEKQPRKDMAITKEQAKYWYAVAYDNIKCGIYN